MSNEIRTSITLTVSNGAYAPPTWAESGSFTQAAIDASQGVMNCTTSYAAIPLGSVSTLGFCMLKNLDPLYNIDVGIEVSSAQTSVMTLKPGESSLFRWKTGVVPTAKSITGPAKLMFWLLID